MKLTDKQINAAAKKMAECMDYPWEFMPGEGRNLFRKHVQDVIKAAGLTAESAEQREQGQEIKCSWCKYCGEGVTTFCRGRSETCAIGLKKIQKSTQPEDIPAIFKDQAS